jgi:hypothetical protein
MAKRVHATNPHFNQSDQCPVLGDIPLLRAAAAKSADDESIKSPVYAIKAVRSAASVFGPAEALLKSAGRVRKFPTREAAKAEARALKASVENENLTYVVIELKD